MDFLDPKKQRRHAFMLYAGYILIGIAILISTVVLVYQANGFGVNRKGQVVQNGLVFFSTEPDPADIYLNGVRNQDQTDARLSLAANQYEVRLTREGYRDWTRNITVQGGDVQNFDYPFLFPKTLNSEQQATYATAPGIASQSRDRRWLLVQQSATANTFDRYDLNNDKPSAEPLVLPVALVTSPVNVTSSWEALQWADDNKHVLLKHSYGNAVEFILLNRDNVSESVNLNKTIGANPTMLTLIDNKYDQYHLHDTSTGVLSQASLNAPSPVTLLENVISYKSYDTNTVLYATAKGVANGRVNLVMYVDDKNYTIRQVSGNTTYVLDVAKYRGAEYVVVGASSDNIVYIYRDPVGQMADPKVTTPVAVRALRVPGANYVSFSSNAQFLVAESGQRFGVYDLFLKRAHTYTIQSPIDAPQTHAEWMDGSHLTYISGGKQIVFDYDERNYQMLAAANPQQGTFFSQDYRYVYGFSTNSSGSTQLNRTGLRTPADL